MEEVLHGRIAVGHTDPRRTIYDLIRGGDAGGKQTLHNLAYFSPLKPGAHIGDHYHKKMWETYLILSGTGTMHLRDQEGHKQRIPIESCPYMVTIPPYVGHTLVAGSQMTLLIAATGEPDPSDMIKMQVL